MIERFFLSLTVLFFTISAVWIQDGPAQERKIEGFSTFELTETDPYTIQLTDKGKPVWEFMYREKEYKQIAHDYRSRFGSAGYFHPVYGLNGEILTANMPEEFHKHHHGIFSGFMNVFVKEPSGRIVSYNTWLDETPIKKHFISWGEKKVGSDGQSFTFTTNMGWFLCHYGENPIVPIPDEKLLDERLTVTTSVIKENDRFGKYRELELEFAWTPVQYEMRLGGDSFGKKAFAALAVRFQTLSDGLTSTIYTEKGRMDKDDMTAPCEFVDYIYPFAGKDKPATGVAIVPDKLNFPTKGWAIRHYGLIVTGIGDLNGIALQPGQTAVQKYKIIIHDKTPLTLK